jgi:lysophospholipase L1-like esterase
MTQTRRGARAGWLRLALLLTAACGDGPGAADAASTVAGQTATAGAVAGHAAGAHAGAAGIVASAAGGMPSVAVAGQPAAGSTSSTIAGRTGAPAVVAGSGAAGQSGSAAAGSDATDPAQAGSGGKPADETAMRQPCPASEACKILPLGDSITFGIGYDGGYRVELFERASSDGKKITFTGSQANGPDMVAGAAFPRSHEGHSGWKIDRLRSLVPMPALETPPHIVLLMIGTNDIAQNDDLANAPDRLGALLDDLAMHAPDALVVVASVIPLGSAGGAVQKYNAAIPDLVKERAAAGMFVQFVDQFDGFPTSELGDGVHPNRQGYERMAAVWYAAIGELLR